MDRPRIRFLPAFFTILAIVLAVAVLLRIQRYAHREDAGTRAAGPAAKVVWK